MNRDLEKLFEKLPPHAIESEMSCLGSMILAGARDPHIIGECMEIVQPADFFMPKHVAICDTIYTQYKLNSTLDSVQLSQLMRDRGIYEEVGGIDYIVELANSVPTAVNGPHYAMIVADKGWLRDAIGECTEIIRKCYGDGASRDDIQAMVEQAFFAISRTKGADQAITASQLLQQAWDELQQRDGGLIGLRTGIVELDKKMCGLNPGNLYVIGARPSIGKTALALSILDYIAGEEKMPCAFFSVEMSKQQLGERMLAMVSGVDGQKIRSNALHQGQVSQLTEAAAKLSSFDDYPLIIDTLPNLTPMQLISRTKRYIAKYGVQAVFVDYIQIMNGEGKSANERVTNISQATKTLAREAKIPVVSLSQLNRANDTRGHKTDPKTFRPRLSDLRDSGSIEQDADVVLLLHRDDYYMQHEPGYSPTNTGNLIIAKQRNGPTGEVKLTFTPSISHFRDYQVHTEAMFGDD